MIGKVGFASKMLKKPRAFCVKIFLRRPSFVGFWKVIKRTNFVAHLRVVEYDMYHIIQWFGMCSLLYDSQHLSLSLSFCIFVVVPYVSLLSQRSHSAFAACFGIKDTHKSSCPSPKENNNKKIDISKFGRFKLKTIGGKNEEIMMPHVPYTYGSNDHYVIENNEKWDESNNNSSKNSKGNERNAIFYLSFVFSRVISKDYALPIPHAVIMLDHLISNVVLNVEAIMHMCALLSNKRP